MVEDLADLSDSSDDSFYSNEDEHDLTKRAKGGDSEVIDRYKSLGLAEFVLAEYEKVKDESAIREKQSFIINSESMTSFIQRSCQPALLRSLNVEYSQFFDPYAFWPLEDRVMNVIKKSTDHCTNFRERVEEITNAVTTGDLAEAARSLEQPLLTADGKAGGQVAKALSTTSSNVSHKTMKTVNVLSKQGHAALVFKESPSQLLKLPSSSVPFHKRLAVSVNKSMTEYCLEQWRVFRKWPLQWGSRRYFQECWMWNGKHSHSNHPGDIRHAIVGSLERLFLVLNISEVSELNSIFLGIVFGVIEAQLIGGSLLTREEVRDKKKNKLLRGRRQKYEAELLAKLDQLYSEDNVRAQLTEMAPKMKRKYYMLHGVYLKKFCKNNLEAMDTIYTEYDAFNKKTCSLSELEGLFSYLLTIVDSLKPSEEVCFIFLF
jgi:hypothetical protein